MTTLKTWGVLGLVIVGLSVAACQRKDDKPKVVKTEKVKVEQVVKEKVSLESLDARVSDIERRMAVARKQYARDKEELRRRLPQ